MAKFVGANQAYGTIKAHSVNETFQHSKKEYGKILHCGRTLPMCTTAAVFYFSSP
jgi:hypothetical protein